MHAFLRIVRVAQPCRTSWLWACMNITGVYSLEEMTWPGGGSQICCEACASSGGMCLFSRQAGVYIRRGIRTREHRNSGTERPAHTLHMHLPEPGIWSSGPGMGSLTHCAGPGTEPASWHCRNTIYSAAPQRKLLLIFKFI